MVRRADDSYALTGHVARIYIFYSACYCPGDALVVMLASPSSPAVDSMQQTLAERWLQADLASVHTTAAPINALFTPS